MPKGNQNLSSKGGGDEELRNRAKFACKPQISSRTSTKIYPWVAWTVKTWSNVRRMSESSEVVGGGTSATALIEEGGGGTSPEDAPLGLGGSTLKWAALYLRKVAPSGSITWIGLPAGKLARPRNNRILWMKIGWINVCSMVELLWTSFKERRNKWGKLIDALDMKA